MPYGLDKKSSQIILNYLKESTGLCGPQYGLHATQTGFGNIIEPELTGTEAGSRKMTKQDPITGKSYEDVVGYDALGGESTESQIMRGREQMPAGYDIKYQGQWTNIANRLNQYIEELGATGSQGFLNWLGNKLPPAGQQALSAVGTLAGSVTSDVINKQIKAQLAQMYLGKGFAGGQATELDPNVKGILDTLGVAVPLAGAASGAGGSNFGVLGDLASKQVQKVAAMGIDPLEWALDKFGARKTTEYIKDLPKQKTNQALSQAGYLAQAKAKGIL